MRGERFEHAGRSVSARVGDPIAEWESAKRGSVWLALPWRGVLHVRGRDAVGFLQGMLTQEVSKLPPGEVRRACQVDRRGRLIAEMWLRRRADGADLETQVDCLPQILDALERHRVMEEVEMEARPDLAVLLLSGPDAARVLTATQCEGWPVREAGENDFHLVTEDPLALGAALSLSGAVEIGGETLDRLRIEAGRPWFGREMDAESLPLEVGLEEAISFEKGCYLGQEAVARLHYRGHLRSRLAGVRFRGAPAPPGASIFLDGRDVGRLRSVASPPMETEGDAIGLATVRAEAFEEGTIVRIGNRDATIENLPFREGRHV